MRTVTHLFRSLTNIRHVAWYPDETAGPLYDAVTVKMASLKALDMGMIKIMNELFQGLAEDYATELFNSTTTSWINTMYE